ncbi:hypothetical protein [Pasteuria penetrans]|uniref:hypothetical protein n=1 Tax=Pasteuria penetrans TaxID=86005 RepID=UPI000FBBF3F4|nr:hypothetical protein [Pasteuria penetrans]
MTTGRRMKIQSIGAFACSLLMVTAMLGIGQQTTVGETTDVTKRNEEATEETIPGQSKRNRDGFTR